MGGRRDRDAVAWLGGWLAGDAVEVTDDPAVLDTRGWWAVATTFEGTNCCVRFARVRRCPDPPPGVWHGPAVRTWESSLDRGSYLAAVQAVRGQIAAGEVYQVNICRVLTAPLSGRADPFGLAGRLAAGNPAPFQGVLAVPSIGRWLVSASPERFLRRTGRQVCSQPVKGTARPGAGMLEKDMAENVMITDMVRNDLGRLAVPGSVDTPDLLRLQSLPGLDHLVSTVTARLADGVGWADLLAAAAPPASVTGAPRASATGLIGRLEPSYAARTAAPSAGWTPTPAAATWRSPSAPSGTPTRGCTSAPARGSPGAATRRGNGARRR